ncbi:hypothetical protein D3C71_1415580 [compost metagenome]
MAGRHLIVSQLEGVFPVPLFHQVDVCPYGPGLVEGAIQGFTTDPGVHHLQIAAIGLGVPGIIIFIHMGELKVI